MNTRSRQILKAKRMQLKRLSPVDRLLMGIDWREFNLAIGLAANAITEAMKHAAEVLVARRIPLAAEMRAAFRMLGIEVEEPNAES